jgi:hypothetical protein
MRRASQLIWLLLCGTCPGPGGPVQKQLPGRRSPGEGCSLPFPGHRCQHPPSLAGPPVGRKPLRPQSETSLALEVAAAAGWMGSRRRRPLGAHLRWAGRAPHPLSTRLLSDGRVPERPAAAGFGARAGPFRFGAHEVRRAPLRSCCRGHCGPGTANPRTDTLAEEAGPGAPTAGRLVRAVHEPSYQVREEAPGGRGAGTERGTGCPAALEHVRTDSQWARSARRSWPVRSSLNRTQAAASMARTVPVRSSVPPRRAKRSPTRSTR